MLHAHTAPPPPTLPKVLQDKILVKDYAAMHGVAAPATLLQVDNCSALSVSDLPTSYVLKSSHLSGCVIVVKVRGY